MTIRLKQSNFGTPRQLNECSFSVVPDQFVPDDDFINQLRLSPGTLFDSELTIGCDTFEQVVLLNAETGFLPLGQRISRHLLALVDGSSGSLVVSDTD